MKLLGIYGSPRNGGNTDILLDETLRAAEEGGASVNRVYARKLKIAPCVGCHGCDKTGRCVMRDDFDAVQDELDNADAIAFATPIHFYTVSAQALAVISRSQALWAARYTLKDERYVGKELKPGALIAVGATSGKKLFDGLRLTAHYFFDATGFSLKHELLVSGVDGKGDIKKHPEHIAAAYEIGKRLASGT